MKHKWSRRTTVAETQKAEEEESFNSPKDRKLKKRKG